MLDANALLQERLLTEFLSRLLSVSCDRRARVKEEFLVDDDGRRWPWQLEAYREDRDALASHVLDNNVRAHVIIAFVPASMASTAATESSLGSGVASDPHVFPTQPLRQLLISVQD
jgi:hypothetical protein